VKVTLKLFASLAIHLPAEARLLHQVALEVEPGATVLDLINRQGIPPEQCAIVLVDGAWVALPERGTRILLEGEVLAIWPPVAGG
jgi:sulfur carrier protein ThiS